MSMYPSSSPALLQEMRICGWKLLLPAPLTLWLIWSPYFLGASRATVNLRLSTRSRVNVHGFRRCGICDLNDLLKVFVGLRLARARVSLKKVHRGKVNIGSQGVGSIGHLAGELFKSMTGIDMVHVPYRSVALALADVINGQMHVQFANSTDSIPQIRGGQVRALAVSSATRLPALPDVPTVAEYLPDYAFESWLGIAGPKNLPAEIVEVLNREINASLARSEIKAKYDDLGLRIHAGSPADFGKLIADDTEKWRKVIRAANIRAE
jgi:tripartite tricarboxylate transporter family receptor